MYCFSKMKSTVLILCWVVLAGHANPSKDRKNKKQEKYIVFPGLDVDNAAVATWSNGYASPWNVAFGNQPYVVGWVAQEDNGQPWQPFDNDEDYSYEDYSDKAPSDTGIDSPYDHVNVDRKRGGQKNIRVSIKDFIDRVNYNRGKNVKAKFDKGIKPNFVFLKGKKPNVIGQNKGGKVKTEEFTSEITKSNDEKPVIVNIEGENFQGNEGNSTQKNDIVLNQNLTSEISNDNATTEEPIITIKDSQANVERFKRNGLDILKWPLGLNLASFAAQEPDKDSWDSSDSNSSEDSESSVESDEPLADVGVDAPYDEVEANRGKRGKKLHFELIMKPLTSGLNIHDAAIDAPHDFVQLDRGKGKST